MKLTIFINIHLDTFFESTRPALVPMGLVDGAWSTATVLTCIGTIAPNTSLEEPTAAVTGIHAVVLARTTVTTHLAWDVQYTTWEK